MKPNTPRPRIWKKTKIHHNLFKTLFLGSKAESVLVKQLYYIQTYMYRLYRKMTIQTFLGSIFNLCFTQKRCYNGQCYKEVCVYKVEESAKLWLVEMITQHDWMSSAAQFSSFYVVVTFIDECLPKHTCYMIPVFAVNNKFSKASLAVKPSV